MAGFLGSTVFESRPYLGSCVKRHFFQNGGLRFLDDDDDDDEDESLL